MAGFRFAALGPSNSIQFVGAVVLGFWQLRVHYNAAISPQDSFAPQQELHSRNECAGFRPSFRLIWSLMPAPANSLRLWWAEAMCVEWIGWVIVLSCYIRDGWLHRSVVAFLGCRSSLSQNPRVCVWYSATQVHSLTLVSSW